MRVDAGDEGSPVSSSLEGGVQRLAPAGVLAVTLLYLLPSGVTTAPPGLELPQVRGGPQTPPEGCVPCSQGGAASAVAARPALAAETPPAPRSCERVPGPRGFPRTVTTRFRSS